MTCKLTWRAETWSLATPFTISRSSRTEAEVVVAELEEAGVRGRGECQPNPRYNDSPGKVIAVFESLRREIESGALDRTGLQQALDPGAARNALDCAFWDLEAKKKGVRVWDLADLPAPGPVQTAYTLSLGTPKEMAEAAAANTARPLIKLKLAGGEDLERVRAVRAALPETAIIVDANEGWRAEETETLAGELAALGVRMIEQPLPATEDAALAGIRAPVPFCADESCHVGSDVAALRDRYGMVNIKLDKTGGLTGALELLAQAREAGMAVMAGCMVATSLSMAPAMLVAQEAVFVDLDGPLLLARDRDPGLRYEDSMVFPPAPDLWG